MALAALGSTQQNANRSADNLTSETCWCHTPASRADLVKWTPDGRRNHYEPAHLQFEESDEVDVLERQFVLVRHKRKKYRCSCGGCVETAPRLPRLIAGGRYSVDFAVMVAIAKYTDHLPPHQ